MRDQFSPLGDNGGIGARAHNMGIHTIGDSDTVMKNFSVDDFMESVKHIPQGNWVGTHCWPGSLPLNQFEKVIVVTTTTYRSQIYRWARAYHHYFAPQWTDLTGMNLIDKLRETAKNYTVPFDPVFHPRVENIEFSDIVETTAEFQYLTQGHDTTAHMQRWKEINKFLYQENFWNLLEVQEFGRAQQELYLKRHYRYE